MFSFSDTNPTILEHDIDWGEAWVRNLNCLLMIRKLYKIGVLFEKEDARCRCFLCQT